MILRQYICTAVTSILAITFLTSSLLTFGYAEYYDRLFIIFLIGLIFFNARNANIMSIALIFLFERFLEEIVFSPAAICSSSPLSIYYQSG